MALWVAVALKKISHGWTRIREDLLRRLTPAQKGMFTEKRLFLPVSAGGNPILPFIRVYPWRLLLVDQERKATRAICEKRRFDSSRKSSSVSSSPNETIMLWRAS